MPRGKDRLLLFGESYGASSRIKQDQAWARQLELLLPDLELVNLAVDGYSMGQAYLRYNTIKKSIDYCGTLMMFVPSADLWRDINTYRFIGEGWDTYTIMPRFLLNGTHLRLAEYKDPSEVYSYTGQALSSDLRAHFRYYDRFYLPSLYERPPLIGNLLVYKIAALAYGKRHIQNLIDKIMDPTSEAMKVTRAIFNKMHEAERAAGRSFVLLILPAEHQKTPDHIWQRMVSFLCEGQEFCWDLRSTIENLSDSNVDRGYDGTHYGPRVNSAIAKEVSEKIEGLLTQSKHCAARFSDRILN